MVRTLRSFAFTALAGLVLLTACGKDEHQPTRIESPPITRITSAVIEDSLQFGAITMGDSSIVCCGLYDPSFVNERVIRVRFYDPANVRPGWEILVLIDRVQQGEVATLPTVVVAPSKVPRITMFVATQSEYSSDAEGSSGTITVHSFSCSSSSIQIHFSVDAILHSEFWDGGTLRVQGTFRGTFPPASCS